MPVARLDKINELLMVELSRILKEDFDTEEDIFLTITRVMTSRTLEHATVWLSILPEQKMKMVLQALKDQIYHLQQVLNKRLVMRKIPKITFKLDETEKQAAHIEKILEDVVK